MHVKLQLVSTFAPGPRVLAWTVGGVVYVRRPFHVLFFAVPRLMHELWHVRDAAPNASHHPWHHFCLKVAHAVRLVFWSHVRAWDELRDKALAMRRDGVVELA